MNYAPFTIQNPGTPPQNITAPDSLRQGQSAEAVVDRLQRRRRLFLELEDQFMFGQAPHLTADLPANAARSDRLAARSPYMDASKAHHDIYYKGFSLVASSEGKVFDLKNESQKVRDEYGPGFGQAALMARRLVESGVSAVEISLGGWDTHNQNFDAHSTRLQPALDRAMSSLVKELVERGRWQNTVIVWMGEFGRTPRINQNSGRDHWARCWSVVVAGEFGRTPRIGATTGNVNGPDGRDHWSKCFSIAMAGAGIRGGQMIGQSDRNGAYPASRPYGPPDFASTVYRALGIDPSSQVRDAIGRPFGIAGGNGRPIDALFS